MSVCPHWIDYATEFGWIVERRGDVGARHVVDGQADRKFFLLGKDNFTELDCHSFDHVDVFYVISVEVVVGDFAFLKKMDRKIGFLITELW